MASNEIFDFNLIDSFTGQALSASGGYVFVAKQGTPQKATLLDPANGMASLANPMTPTNGAFGLRSRWQAWARLRRSPWTSTA